MSASSGTHSADNIPKAAVVLRLLVAELLSNNDLSDLDINFKPRLQKSPNTTNP